MLVRLIWRREMATPGAEVWRRRMPLKQKFNIFSTIQQIETYFIVNVLYAMQQKTRKTEAKLSIFFAAIQLTES